MLVSASISASAAPITAGEAVPAAEKQMTKVYWGSCHRWRHRCRYRWGGGWRYRRCMRRHCWRRPHWGPRPYYRCRKWRHRCHYRYGGGWRYRRCMRRHGC
jgi:hypothetical protein